MTRDHLEASPVFITPLLLTVLIPARNEQENIGPTIESLGALLRRESIPFELLVVNDGSTDGTADEVRVRQAAWPELRLVDNPGLAGLGRAVRFGLDHFAGDVIAVVMADRSDWPEDVVRCYRLIEQGYDCVFGSRFMRGSRTTGYPRVKYIANRVGNKVIQAMFLTRHNDLTNAFKMYRRDVIESITPLHAAHFNITIEMSLSALIRGYRIAMVPIHWSGRTWGSSKLRLREMGRRYLCTLIKIWCERILIQDDVMADLEDRRHGRGVVELHDSTPAPHRASDPSHSPLTPPQGGGNRG